MYVCNIHILIFKFQKRATYVYVCNILPHPWDVDSGKCFVHKDLLLALHFEDLLALQITAPESRASYDICG